VQTLAHHVEIGMEPPDPKAVTYDGDRAPFLGLGIEASDTGMDSKHVEEIRAGVHFPGYFRMISGCQLVS